MNQIKLQNTNIERVGNFQFLGIVLDETLNWNSHIDKIVLKLSRNIGILYKLKHILPLPILKLLYNSLFLPHLTYGILAWGKKSTRVVILQKKALRVITRSRFNDHTEPLFKSLNLLKFDDLFILTALKFYYNYCHRLLPFYLQSFELCQRQEIQTHDIRSKHNLHTLRAKIEWLKIL